jgi:hypothetical protein
MKQQTSGRELLLHAGFFTGLHEVIFQKISFSTLADVKNILLIPLLVYYITVNLVLHSMLLSDLSFLQHKLSVAAKLFGTGWAEVY